MAIVYGLTPLGFVPKQLAVIKTEIEESLRSEFGESLNLLPESVFGQLVGIYAAREALIWQLAEAVYDSQYPSGAEGTSVDNILALTNLKRLPATPTITAPITESVPGLLLFGTPATLIPAGSLISVFGQPTFQFSLDTDVTILASVDAIQGIFFSSIPDSGNFKIKIGLLTTADIAFNATAADVQTAIRLLTGYGDVTVSGTFGTSFTVNFVGSSGAQAQPLIDTADNTLLTIATAVNIKATMNQTGAPAQGIGSATCTQTGPIPAPANTLTVIDTPVSGWASVNNPLDAIPGTNLETDTEAMDRRKRLLESQGNGPLQSIVQKVLLLPNVEQAIGFENRNDAALQQITFSSIPTSGNYKILLNGFSTTTLAHNATAAQLQTALRLLPGFSALLVSGDYQFGFTIDFNGGNGGQPQLLMSVVDNTLSDGSPVTASVAYNRPGHSFEIVAVGGEDQAIAQTIFGAKPAGIETYGNTHEFVTDPSGVFPINFSRPDSPSVYVTVAVTVDADTFPGDGIMQIQNELIAIGNLIPIGGLIVGFGTDGLIGAFNNIPGIITYDLKFGLLPNPSSNANIQLLPEQRALFESFNIIVSVTEA